MNSYKDTHETRIALLEQSIININETMNRIEKNMDEGFKSVNSRLWTNFYWTLGAIAALGTIMAHGFEWF